MAKICFSDFTDLEDYLSRHPDIKFVKVAYTDARGTLRSCTYTSKRLSERTFTYGLPLDASSIPMMQGIDDSDYICRPDIATAILDPFATHKTILVLGDIRTPHNKSYGNNPRCILKRATEYLRYQNIANIAKFGPEAEFFVFDNVSFETSANFSKYCVDGDEGSWNQGKLISPNLGHRSLLKQGYMEDSCNSALADLRSDILINLENIGIRTEKHHHEVATCQMECNICPLPGVAAGDALQLLKYVVKNSASRVGKTATFMPKPLKNDNGSGMHINISLWEDERNLFYDAADEYNLSGLAQSFIGGVLKHCDALAAFTCPSTNSYRRLVPGFEAPIHIAYSAGNRSTAIRIPKGTDERSTRIEFRIPDGSCCIYLAYAAILMAGVDGIIRELRGCRAEGNLADPTHPVAKGIATLPASLREALHALENDQEFLTVRGVFTPNFISQYIEYKRTEVSLVGATPHPEEFGLYYGC